MVEPLHGVRLLAGDKRVTEERGCCHAVGPLSGCGDRCRNAAFSFRLPSSRRIWGVRGRGEVTINARSRGRALCPPSSSSRLLVPFPGLIGRGWCGKGLHFELRRRGWQGPCGAGPGHAWWRKMRKRSRRFAMGVESKRVVGAVGRPFSRLIAVAATCVFSCTMLASRTSCWRIFQSEFERWFNKMPLYIVWTDMMRFL